MKYVFVHGFLGLPTDWNSIISKLKVKQPNLSFDCVNLWQELKSNPSLSMAGWADLFNKRYDEPVTAIGYSLGGRLLYEALQSKPENFKQLILISSNPFSLPAEVKTQRKPWQEMWTEKFLHEDWGTLINQWNALALFNNSKIFFDRSANQFDRKALVHALVQWSPAQQKKSIQSAKSFSNQLKWICGKEDKKYLQLYQTFQKVLTDHKFIFVAGAYHRVPWEYEESVIHELL